MTKSIPSLSKMWLKILNFNTTLFPALQEELGVLSSKEEKLIRILDFAEIEKFVSEVKITNPPKHRKEITRAFVAKAAYNIQTTRDLIDRLKVDRVLRIICGWRYARSIPSESTFSLVMSSTVQMLNGISTATDIGRKLNAKGNGYAWIGGKLHIGVVDGDIPITAIYTCAKRTRLSSCHSRDQ